MILKALTAHPRLITLHLSQSFATKDLGMRYNYLEDDVSVSVEVYVSNCSTLRMLELGMTSIALSTLSISEEIVKLKTLVVFSAKSVYVDVSTKAEFPINERIQENIRQSYRVLTLLASMPKKSVGRSAPKM